MSKLEIEVDAEIVIEAAKHRCVLERNNSGALKDDSGRQVRYGLGNISKAVNERMKSSDRIGGTQVTITPEMVGQTVLVFTAVEVKREGWTFNPKDKREVAQKNYLDWVKARGGIAGFVASLDDMRKLLGK